jgi:hypothetical protein
MSNTPNKEQNVKIELSENQADPGRARADDFAVRKYAPLDTPFHNQHGSTIGEESRLLNERFVGNPSKPQPVRNVAGGR